jgi:hypothetical protein
VLIFGRRLAFGGSALGRVVIPDCPKVGLLGVDHFAFFLGVVVVLLRKGGKCCGGGFLVVPTCRPSLR